MHALYKKHGQALGCTGYGQFCELWPKVCALLDAPARLQEYPGGCAFYGPPLQFDTVSEALEDMHDRVAAPNARRVRVVLLDGTVIREWVAT
jgi:hypothetical protein